MVAMSHEPWTAIGDTNILITTDDAYINRENEYALIEHSIIIIIHGRYDEWMKFQCTCLASSALGTATG